MTKNFNLTYRMLQIFAMTKKNNFCYHAADLVLFFFLKKLFSCVLRDFRDI